MKKIISVLFVVGCILMLFTSFVYAEELSENQDTVIYDLPSSVKISENNCFEANTTVKVENMTSGSVFTVASKSMESVATTYAVYEFTAIKDGVPAVPKEKLTVIFNLPINFGTNVLVYKMENDGTLEALQVDVTEAERTASVQIELMGTYILSDEDTKPHVHSYTKKVTAPTCVARGYTTYTCTCGDKYTSDYVETSAHPYKSVISLPTCTAKGYTAYTCTACGHSYTGDLTDTVDHVMGDWKQTKAPTYTEPGEEKRFCINCEHFETRTLPILEPPITTAPPDTTVPTTTAPITTPDTTPQLTANPPQTAFSPVTTAPVSPTAPYEPTSANARDVVIIALIGAIAIVFVAIVVVLVTSKKRRNKNK